uniref:RNA-directed DNA polymerase n=1 Tax=Strongyloides papillosus TaxID=174720 RepID=A0A0N5BEP0_STREA
MKGNSNDSAQQAEVTALTLALEEIHRLAYSKTIPKNEPILIATDSDYVFKTVRIYFKEWESRGFKKANNETPAFLEKWKASALKTLAPDWEKDKVRYIASQNHKLALVPDRRRTLLLKKLIEEENNRLSSTVEASTMNTLTWISIPAYKESDGSVKDYFTRLELLLDYDEVTEDKKRYKAILSKMPSSIIKEISFMSTEEKEKIKTVEQLKAYIAKSMGNDIVSRNADIELGYIKIREDKRYIKEDLQKVLQLIQATNDGTRNNIIKRMHRFVKDNIRNHKLRERLINKEYDQPQELIADMTSTCMFYDIGGRDFRPRTESSKKRPDTKCFFCGIRGHKEVDCKKKKEQDASKKFTPKTYYSSSKNSNQQQPLQPQSTNSYHTNRNARITQPDEEREAYREFLEDQLRLNSIKTIRIRRNATDYEERKSADLEVNINEDDDEKSSVEFENTVEKLTEDKILPCDYYVTAYIGCRPLHCLIDNGSHLSLVRYSIAKEYGFSKPNVKLFAGTCANGTELPLAGEIKLTLQLSLDYAVEFPFAVTLEESFPDCNSHIVLGSDFMKYIKATIRYADDSLIINNKIVKLTSTPNMPLIRRDSYDRPCRLILKQPDSPEEFRQLISCKYKSSISTDKYDVGKCSLMKPNIKLRKNELPYFIRYTPAVGLLDEIDKEVEQWCAHDICTEDPEVEFIFNIVAALKKDKSLRLCLDLRPLNFIITDIHYYAPKFSEIVQKLAGARYFSNIDLTNSFLQLEMESTSQKKIGFKTRKGFFRMKRMPYGLKTSPAHFQKAIDITIKGLDCAIAYCDDIIIGTRGNLKCHLEDVIKTMDRIAAAGFKINLKKSTFCSEEVVFLSYTFNQHGYKPCLKSVQAIDHIKPPKDLKQLRAFLGSISYFRNHIPDAARLESPLTDLLKKNCKYFPNWNQPFYLFCDASTEGYGAVLTQRDEDMDGDSKEVQKSKILKGGKSYFPIAYYSKKIKPYKRKLPSTHLELRAMSAALTHFSSWIFLQKVNILTDHRTLKELVVKNDDPRLYKFISNINCYSPNIIWIPGVSNSFADMLSRSHKDDEIRRLKRGRRKKSSNDDLKVENETVPVESQLFPPENVKMNSLINEIPNAALRHFKLIFCAHDKHGHQDMAKTLSILRSITKEKWENQVSDVKEYIKNCSVCWLRNETHKHQLVPESFTSNKPFAVLAMDLLGPLPGGNDGYRHIVSATCVFSKFLILYPTRTTSAQELTEGFLTHVYNVHGLPLVIRSDNSTNFRSKLFGDVCSLLRVKLSTCTPYHKPGNTHAERSLRTTQSLIAKYLLEHSESNWSSCLPIISLFYNSSVNATTRFPPYYLANGRLPRLPLHLLDLEQLKKGSAYDDRKILLELTQAREAARQTTIDERSKRNNTKDRKQKTCVDLKIGDTVLLRNFDRSEKLEPLWDSTAYLIVNVNGARITVKPKGSSSRLRKLRNVHADDVKKISSSAREE